MVISKALINIGINSNLYESIRIINLNRYYFESIKSEMDIRWLPILLV